jgi:DNA-binding MarR family transcriptional regulator
MSYQAVAAVLETSTARGADRLVLLVIAHHADRAGRQSFPGRARIAALAGLNPSTVTRSLAWLEAAGEITRERGAAPRGGRSNLYAVVLPGLRDLALVRDVERLANGFDARR